MSKVTNIVRATLPIKNLRNDVIFVRRKPDQKRVDSFKSILETGGKLDPILVTRVSKTVVDGRHRILAHQALGLEEVAVEYTNEMNPVDLIFKAFAANTGGALPPNDDDRTLVIEQLLDAKVPQQRIIDHLPGHKDLTRKLIQWVKSNKVKKNQNAARAAVAAGEMTAKDAALKFNVDFDTLKAQLGGRRSKRQQTLISIAGSLQHRARSYSSGVSKDMEKLLTMHADRELTDAQARKVMGDSRTRAKQIMSAAENWGDRLEAQIMARNKATTA